MLLVPRHAIQRGIGACVLGACVASCGSDTTKSPDACWLDPAGCAGSAGQASPGGSGGSPSAGASGQANPVGGSGGSAAGGTPSAGAPSGGTSVGGSATGGSGGVVGGTGGVTAAGSGGTAGSSGAGSGGGGAGGTATCTGGTLPVCLAHRYSFDGTGMVVTDSVGSRNGTAVGASVSGGTIALSGTEQYVTLPAGIASRFTSATFEAWVTWTGGTTNWQRIFDFGNNTATAGDQGEGTTYLFLTPRNSLTQVVRAAFSVSGPAGEALVDGVAPLPATAGTHVAVVVNASAQSLELYVNGSSVGAAQTTVLLSSLTDGNNWFGRSQFSADTEFAGSIQEFRIYGLARTAGQIQASFTAGPDALPAQ